jgi:hypothetical protein
VAGAGSDDPLRGDGNWDEAAELREGNSPEINAGET